MALNKDTLNDLRQEAKRIDAALASFTREFQELNRKRMELSQAKAAIEAVIDRATPDTKPEKTTTHGETPQLFPKHENTGFRDAIRAVLKASTSPMMPKDVQEALERAGYRDGDARTPLRIRIGNELFKLAKTGVLRRNGSGYVSAQR